MPPNQSLRIHLYSQPVSQEKTQRLLACLAASDTAQITEGGELPAGTDVLILPYADRQQDDDALYTFVKQIENQPNLERILILPRRFQSGKNHFPAALHDIRFQQHHLVFHDGEICSPQVVEAINTIASEILIKRKQAAEHNSDSNKGVSVLWNKTRVRTGIHLLPVFALLVWGFIQIMPRTLTLLASNDTLRNVVSPPEITSVWMSEGFNPLDQSLWTQVHRFKGLHFVSIDSENTDLILAADKPVEEDVYTLQSTQTWPMEKLQTLLVKFSVDETAATGAEAVLTQQIVNTENPVLAIACEIQSGIENGTIECFAQDEKQKVVLSNTMTFTLKESHELAMVFIPSRYGVRFFLDGQFYGEMEIPSVEYWRGRNFSLIVESSLKNLTSGTYTARIETLTLSQQP